MDARIHVQTPSPLEDWLHETEKLLPRLENLANKLPSTVRDACFPILLKEALTRIALPTLSPKAPLVVNTSGGPTVLGKVESVLARAGITVQQFEGMVDLESGEVLVTNLGSQKSDMQRTLACLIATRNAVREGSFTVDRDQLKVACERFGCYDQGNFARNMRTAEAGSIKVFVERGAGWEITPPGFEFVAGVLKNLAPSGGA